MHAQGTEFTVYPNGYIYSEASMAQLQPHRGLSEPAFQEPARWTAPTDPCPMRGRLFHLEEQVEAVLQDIKGGLPSWSELMKK